MRAQRREGRARTQTAAHNDDDSPRQVGATGAGHDGDQGKKGRREKDAPSRAMLDRSARGPLRCSPKVLLIGLAATALILFLGNAALSESLADRNAKSFQELEVELERCVGRAHPSPPLCILFLCVHMSACDCVCAAACACVVELCVAAILPGGCVCVFLCA